jgi:threonine dehydratase
VAVPGSGAFTATLATTGNHAGAVTYTQDIPGQSADLVFTASTGEITTTGILSVGAYTVSGSAVDPDGDTGTCPTP